MPKTDDFSVPKNTQADYSEVVRVTDEFCKAMLNEEYALVCRKIAAALCRKRPCPIKASKAKSWAAGIVYAAGQVNFLFDKKNEPYMSADDLAAKFGVSKSTAAGKSRIIGDALKIGPMHPSYCLPSRLADNPLIWMIEVDGFLVDIRRMPKEVQEEAFRQGLIPCMPEDLPLPKQPAEQPAKPAPVPKPAKPAKPQPVDNSPTLFDFGEKNG